MSTANYSQVVSATTDALKATTSAEFKLKQAGEFVAAFYITREAFREVKRQFEADAIIPALDKKLQAYLKLEIERGDKSEQANINRENKATARGTVAAYFNKIENHAFPKPKAEATPREPSLAFVEDLIKVAKKGQKLEAAQFNLVKVMAHLNAALKEIGVSADEADEV
jgi:hypothetical protein